MDAESLSEFNTLKAEVNRDLYPATIEFTARKGTTYVCAFSETRDDGGLHSSGQVVQHHQTGALYWPVSATHTPDLMSTFKITVCAGTPALVGTVWKIMERRPAAHEPTVKFECLKQEG